MSDPDMSVGDWGIDTSSEVMALDAGIPHPLSPPLQYVSLFEQCGPKNDSVEVRKLESILRKSGLETEKAAQILNAVLQINEHTVASTQFYWSLAQAAMAQHTPDHEIPSMATADPGIMLELHLNDDTPGSNSNSNNSNNNSNSSTNTNLNTNTTTHAPSIDLDSFEYLPTASPSVLINVKTDNAGSFLLKHTEFELAGVFSKSEVKATRRYRDFVWLHDALAARFPFRNVPVLPPKVLSVNGRFFTTGSQAQFLEKRAQSLQRFINLLIAHPVLSRDMTVTLFLLTPDPQFNDEKNKVKNFQMVDDLVATPLFVSTFSNQTVEEWHQREVGCSVIATNITGMLGFLEHEIARTIEQRPALETFNVNCQKIANTLKHVYPTESEDRTAIIANLDKTGGFADKWSESSAFETLKLRQGAVYQLKLYRDMITSVRMLFQRQRILGTNTIPELQKKIEEFERKLRVLENQPNVVRDAQFEETKNNLRLGIQQTQEEIKEQKARDMDMKMIISQELKMSETTMYQLSVFMRSLALNLTDISHAGAQIVQQLSDTVAASPIQF